MASLVRRVTVPLGTTTRTRFAAIPLCGVWVLPGACSRVVPVFKTTRFKFHSKTCSLPFGIHILSERNWLQQQKQNLKMTVYLFMKEGSLDCFVLYCSYEIHWTRMLQIVFLASLQTSWQGGVHGLGSIAFVPAVLEYWMIFSLKIKLNCSWKFQRNWNVPLVLLERSWWEGFNGIYLVRFGFRMWEILIF